MCVVAGGLLGGWGGGTGRKHRAHCLRNPALSLNETTNIKVASTRSDWNAYECATQMDAGGDATLFTQNPKSCIYLDRSKCQNVDTVLGRWINSRLTAGCDKKPPGMLGNLPVCIGSSEKQEAAETNRSYLPVECVCTGEHAAKCKFGIFE